MKQFPTVFWSFVAGSAVRGQDEVGPHRDAALAAGRAQAQRPEVRVHDAPDASQACVPGAHCGRGEVIRVCMAVSREKTPLAGDPDSDGVLETGE